MWLLIYSCKIYKCYTINPFNTIYFLWTNKAFFCYWWCTIYSNIWETKILISKRNLSINCRNSEWMNTFFCNIYFKSEIFMFAHGYSIRITRIFCGFIFTIRFSSYDVKTFISPPCWCWSTLKTFLIRERILKCSIINSNIIYWIRTTSLCYC